MTTGSFMFSKYRYGSVTEVPYTVSATGRAGGTAGGVGNVWAAGALACRAPTVAAPRASAKTKGTQRNMEPYFMERRSASFALRDARFARSFRMTRDALCAR